VACIDADTPFAIVWAVEGEDSHTVSLKERSDDGSQAVAIIAIEQCDNSRV
jgi:hypothetical protein